MRTDELSSCSQRPIGAHVRGVSSRYATLTSGDAPYRGVSGGQDGTTFDAASAWAGGVARAGFGAFRLAVHGAAVAVRSGAYGDQSCGFAAATGVGDEVLDAMHLSAYDGTVLDFAGLDPTDGRSVQRLRLKQWALFHSSRACPDCLAETGGVWQTWWRLGGAAVCPRHGLLLHSSCPRCGMEIRQVTTRHHSALSRTTPALPGACNNRQDAVACGFPLSELRVGRSPAASATSTPEMIRTRPTRRSLPTSTDQVYVPGCGMPG